MIVESQTNHHLQVLPENHVSSCDCYSFYVLHFWSWKKSLKCLQMHLGMVAVMNAAIDLEDPFATDGVDGVYCNESLFEVEQVIAARLNVAPGSCVDLSGII